MGSPWVDAWNVCWRTSTSLFKKGFLFNLCCLFCACPREHFYQSVCNSVKILLLFIFFIFCSFEMSSASSELQQTIKERITNYKTAIINAKKAGESAKVRRYERGLKVCFIIYKSCQECHSLHIVMKHRSYIFSVIFNCTFSNDLNVRINRIA